MITQAKARELAQRFGVRMCDENGDTHNEELYCLGLDDIIDMAKALAQQEQEPVAYIPLKALEQLKPPMLVLNNVPIYGYSAEGAVAVYTNPSQRTWAGLTEEDKKEYVAQDFGGNRLDAMDWAAKRLQEKNT